MLPYLSLIRNYFYMKIRTTILIFSSHKIGVLIAIIEFERGNYGLFCLHLVPRRYPDGHGRCFVSAAIGNLMTAHILKTRLNECPSAHITMLFLTPNEN